MMTEYEENLIKLQQDFVVSNLSPRKLSTQHHFLFDCRLKLLLKEDHTLLAGERKYLPSTCLLSTILTLRLDF